MVAPLHVVEYVGCVHGSDAVPAIKAVRRNFYVKGQDYRNPEGDITGRIVAEREAAEEYGGQLLFSEEITYSSTELIHQQPNVFDPPIRGPLHRLRQKRVGQKITDLMERLT